MTIHNSEALVYMDSKIKVKVSVILPSLNVKDYIEEALLSVMNQTLKEIEIICIDAGSTDGTCEIIQRLAEKDSRVQFVHSDIKSYGYQVNLGIRMAKGDYIAILETDDYTDLSMYEDLYEVAFINDCDYVKSDYSAYWTMENGDRFFIKRTCLSNGELYGNVIEPSKYHKISIDDWYLWNGIYKKSFLIENGIVLSETSGAAFQDIGFMYQTTTKAKRALYLKKVHYKYCLDRGDSSSNSGKGIQFSYYEYKKIMDSFESGPSNTDLHILRMFYCRMAKAFITCCKNPDTWNYDRTYYGWFKKELSGAIEKGIIDADILTIELWKKLERLLVSEKYYKEKLDIEEKNMKNILGNPSEFPLIIFGCGHNGYEVFRWMKKNQYRPFAFMDNNASLWGMVIDGIRIENPQNIKSMPVSSRYIIANERYYDEIQKQLLDMGVEEKNICIYE